MTAMLRWPSPRLLRGAEINDRALIASHWSSSIGQPPGARSAMMGGNALDAFGYQIAGHRVADVAQTEDTDHPLALVDHRQPADLQLFHVPYRLGEVIVLPAAMDALGHHIPRGRAARIEAVLRQAFADDVAVGHHANKLVVLPDGNRADIMLTHQFREFGDRGVRTDPLHALMHRDLDFHLLLPSRFGITASHMPELFFARLFQLGFLLAKVGL